MTEVKEDGLLAILLIDWLCVLHLFANISTIFFHLFYADVVNWFFACFV